MRKRIIVIITGILLLISAWVGTAYAQDVPGYPVPGYPVETETEVPTKPPENTPEPTQPPQPNPTEAPPTWVPTQPTPTPSATPDFDLPTCPFSRVHPVLMIISERFDVPFEDVADMFCSEHMGIGEIVAYFEDLELPDEGLGHFPGHDGHGWGLFWRVFYLPTLAGENS